MLQMTRPELLQQRLKAKLRHARGFTLIELAVVLFLVALVLGGVMTPLSTRIEQEERKQTEDMLEDIRESLIGYALVNGHLPCPDCPTGLVDADCTAAGTTTDDGIEDGVDGTNTAVSPRAGNFATCAIEIGNLPWVTLGVSEFDAWGNRFVYGVDQDFADDDDGTACSAPATAGISFSLCSLGGATIHSTVPNPPASVVAENIPALVYSYGANGNAFGGVAPTSAIELENWWTDTDTDFVSTTFNQSAANQFDDIVMWITPSTLIYKMVNAERLP